MPIFSEHSRSGFPPGNYFHATDDGSSSATLPTSKSERDKALIRSINEFSGTPIEVLRSIAFSGFCSSNDPAVCLAVGAKLNALTAAHPTEQSTIDAFRSCFFKALQREKTPQAPQERRAEVTEIDQSPIFSLTVKAPSVEALQQISKVQLQVDEWLSDVRSGTAKSRSDIDQVIQDFEKAVKPIMGDLTIAQLGLSCLYNTISSLADLDNQNKDLRDDFKDKFINLAHELCQACLKEHSLLDPKPGQRPSELCENQIAAALLVFEFSATLMHEIRPEISKKTTYR